MVNKRIAVTLACCLAVTGITAPAALTSSPTDAQAYTTCSSCHGSTPSGAQPTKQTIKVKKKSAHYKVKALKKKAKKFKIGARARGSVSCVKISGSSCVSISSAGKVKVKKGTPFGLYTMRVIVKASSYGHFNEAVKTITVKVTVQ